MTSSNVNNFVTDLVEMAKAMDELPKVQADLSKATDHAINLFNEITSLRADLEQSRTYAATLEQRVRTVEAERDDAEIRFLELDEKANKISAVLDTIASSAMGAFDQLSPPKPQPEPVVEAQSQGSSEAFPLSAPTTSFEDLSKSSAALQLSTSQDQSEVNPPAQPSASTSDTPNDAGQAHATTTDVGSTGGEGSGAKSGLYTGKHYFDHPVYVSYWDWISGGGTEEGYRWLPDVGSSA